MKIEHMWEWKVLSGCLEQELSYHQQSMNKARDDLKQMVKDGDLAEVDWQEGYAEQCATNWKMVESVYIKVMDCRPKDDG